ncbi:MAG: hypothetical protein JNK72_00430 [Myxococcales bacterium]|nr:hypothetical protein [Myxococcales bacterium]
MARTINGVVEDVGAGGGGADTSTALQTAPATGWTSTADGAVTPSSGGLLFELEAGDGDATVVRDAPFSPYAPAVEWSGRLADAPSAVAAFTGLAICDATRSAGLLLQVGTTTDAVQAFHRVPSGSWSYLGASSRAALPASGELWVRLVLGDRWVSWWQGAGATRPTSWTLVYRAELPWQLLTGALTHLSVMALPAESTAFTVTWADLQYRLLTGAPT